MLTEEFKLSTPNTYLKVNFLKIESQDILLICQPVYKTTSQNILYLTSYCYQISISNISISNIQLISLQYYSFIYLNPSG